MNEYPNQNQAAPEGGGNQDALRDAIQGIENRYGSPYQYTYNQQSYYPQPNQIPGPQPRTPPEKREM